MSKRGRATGTGDVNPQFLTMDTGQAGAVDDYTVNRVQLPVARIGGSKTKAIVFEILRIDWYVNVTDFADATWSSAAFLSTNTGRTDGDPSTLASFSVDSQDPVTLGMVLQHRSVVGAVGMYSVP